MDIGYFFQLQRTFKGGGVVVPTTEIKEVAGIGRKDTYGLSVGSSGDLEIKGEGRK